MGGEEWRFWIRSVAPVLSGAVEPPSGSGFGVNMGPVDPFPPQGTQTPGLPTVHFYFPGCKMPLAIWAHGVFLFFSLIFTHKMCIIRTKAAMMSSLVSANFFPVPLRNSSATSISNLVVCIVHTNRHSNVSCSLFFLLSGFQRVCIALSFTLPQLQKIAVPLLNKFCVFFSCCTCE